MDSKEIDLIKMSKGQVSKMSQQRAREVSVQVARALVRNQPEQPAPLVVNNKDMQTAQNLALLSYAGTCVLFPTAFLLSPIIILLVYPFWEPVVRLNLDGLLSAVAKGRFRGKISRFIPRFFLPNKIDEIDRHYAEITQYKENTIFHEALAEEARQFLEHSGILSIAGIERFDDAIHEARIVESKVGVRKKSRSSRNK